MDIKPIVKYLEKVHLKGVCNRILVRDDGEETITTSKTDNGGFFVYATSKNSLFNSNSFGIHKLNELINIFKLYDSADISLIDSEDGGNEVDAILVANDEFRTEFLLSDITMIKSKTPSEPPKRLPSEYDINIKIDKEFISKLVKASGSLKDADFVYFTIKRGKLCLILKPVGEKTNKISIDISGLQSEYKDFEGEIKFLLDPFIKLLTSNTDMESINIKISLMGVMVVKCSDNELDIDYYMGAS